MNICLSISFLLSFFLRARCVFHPWGLISLGDTGVTVEYDEALFSVNFYQRDARKFTLSLHSSLCSTSISEISSSSVGGADGIIVSRGDCGVREHAQHAHDQGYKYALLLDDVDRDPLTPPLGVKMLDIHTTRVSAQKWKEAYAAYQLSAMNDKAELFLHFLPHITSPMHTCLVKTEVALNVSAHYFLRSSIKFCVSRAISLYSDLKVQFDADAYRISVRLAELLWQHDYTDDAYVLIKWLTHMHISPATQSEMPSGRDLFPLRVQFASLLFTMGEWATARTILMDNIEEFAQNVPSQQDDANSLMRGTCALAALSTFATLNTYSGMHEGNDRSELYQDDWTVPGSRLSHPSSRQDIVPMNHPDLNLSVCIDLMLAQGDEDPDEFYAQWVTDISSTYSNHPSLWLVAGELEFVSKRYGILNVVGYIAALSAWFTESEKGPTTHMRKYLSLLESSMACNEDNTIQTQKKKWCDGSLFSLAGMPRSSLNGMKKHLGVRRNTAIRRIAIRYFLNDMSEVHVRMGVFWDEYGAFSSSQRHFIARVEGLSCLYTAAGSNTGSSECITKTASLGCLFPRGIVTTPVVFSNNDEFLGFREEQLRAIAAAHNILANVLDESSADNAQERNMLIATERKVTSTPPGMMVGYQYELQMMGDRSVTMHSVETSGLALLKASNMLQDMCEVSGIERVLEVSPDVKHNSQSGYIRVGFLSRYFYDHSVGRLIYKVVEGLSVLQTFEVNLLCICCSNLDGDDAVRRTLRNASNLVVTDLGGEYDSEYQCSLRFSSNPLEIRSAQQRVIDLHLDILVYPEVGMDAITMSFAARRLSPIQMVFWGHPVSQGLSTIDYFISSELFDVHNPKCQYPRLGQEKCPVGFTSTEQTVLLPGLGTFFLRPAIPGNFSVADNEALFPYTSLDGLVAPDTEMHLYILPHTIMKYSTAFIRTLAYILIKDKGAVILILYSSNQRLWFEKLRRSVELQVKRLVCQTSITPEALYDFPETDIYDSFACVSAGCDMCCECVDSAVVHPISRRLVMLPKLSRESYHRVLLQRSVVLDPFPFGMGVTALESFSLGVPIITLPMYQSAPPLVLGMIRRMGVDGSTMIADNITEYVNLAIRMASSQFSREEIVRSILSRADVLFEDSAVIGDWEEMLNFVYTTVRNGIENIGARSIG